MYLAYCDAVPEPIYVVGKTPKIARALMGNAIHEYMAHIQSFYQSLTPAELNDRFPSVVVPAHDGIAGILHLSQVPEESFNA
jgi:hypothetical protein